jgi:protein involved in polysaccharide export with SLBB domain
VFLFFAVIGLSEAGAQGLSPFKSPGVMMQPTMGGGSLNSGGCPDEIEGRLRMLEDTQPSQAAEIRRLLCGRGQDMQGGQGKQRLRAKRPPEQPLLIQPAKPEKSEKADEGRSAVEGFFAEGQLADADGAVGQFGYELFNRDPAAFVPSATSLVGPDYLIGPDDEFTVTIWGLVDGMYTVQVSREGTVVFPKVGEVQVAGVPYGQLRSHIERAFARHFKNFNLSVAMGQLRGIQIYIVGEVQAPGSYTLNSLSTIFTALFASGGPRKTGTLRDIQLLRNGKVVKRLDLYEFLLKGDKSKDIKVQDQDTIFVPLIGPVVGVAGQIQRPAIYELNGPATVGDVLTLAGGVKPTSYLTRLQIERVTPHRERVALDYDFQTDGGSDQLNTAMTRMPVQNMDLMRVFPINSAFQQVVYLKGHVVRPGPHQFRKGMRVADLVKSLSDLKPDAFTKAEVNRYALEDGRTLVETRTVDLAGSLAGDPEHNIELKEQDVLIVRPIPPGDIGWEVTLKGEVKRPGLYMIKRGDRLSTVLKRAGGLTSAAYPRAAIFTRQSVKAAQEAQIQKLGALSAQRASAESSALAVGGLDKVQMDAQKELLAIQKDHPQQLTSLVTLGRMVVHIDAPDKLENTTDDLILENGDSLEIPSMPETVSLLGSVRNPTALHYKPGLGPTEYVSLGGGLTADADWDAAYVLKADGSAIALSEGRGRNYFGHNGTNGKSPEVSIVDRGDAIVVPTRIEVRTRPAPVWQAVPDPSEATQMPQQIRK